MAATPSSQHGAHSGHAEDSDFGRSVREAVRVMQKFALPLISGVLLALLWSNVHIQSYHAFLEASWTGGATLVGHDVNLHFLVNDIFMCFFFGLAIKEVTEALLPGGSLYPLSKAVNPLMATFGGVIGPAATYAGAVTLLYVMGAFDGYMCAVGPVDSGHHRRLALDIPNSSHAMPAAHHAAAVHEALHHEAFHDEASHGPAMELCSFGALINGWGVPTATDISLAWMGAVMIFGSGHPAINFLLLLAIVDDAIGMVIIAIWYGDPAHPVEVVWLLLVLGAMALAFGMRYMRVPSWAAYIFVSGPVSWLGLIKAHVHPALALCFIIPFMPAAHPHGGHEGAHDEEAQAKKAVPTIQRSFSQRMFLAAWKTAKAVSQYNYEEAPLHVFEHTLKLPVDIGMFFFGLANAGVQLNTVGYMTGCVLLALIVGKTLGIACFGLLASRLGFPLPPGVTTVDLFAMGAIGGIGLTVALFVANEAFVDRGLQGQAKFAAVLSIMGVGFAWVIRSFGGAKGGVAKPQPDEPLEGEGGVHLEDVIVEEVAQEHMGSAREPSARTIKGGQAKGSRAVSGMQKSSSGGGGFLCRALGCLRVGA